MEEELGSAQTQLVLTGMLLDSLRQACLLRPDVRLKSTKMSSEPSRAARIILRSRLFGSMECFIVVFYCRTGFGPWFHFDLLNTYV